MASVDTSSSSSSVVNAAAPAPAPAPAATTPAPAAPAAPAATSIEQTTNTTDTNTTITPTTTTTTTTTTTLDDAKTAAPTTTTTTANSADAEEYVPTYSLYLRDLPAGVTEDELTSVFETFGTVYSTNIVRSRRYGFVNFTSDESRQLALEGGDTTPNEYTIRGQTVRVYRSREKTTVFVGGLPDTMDEQKLRELLTARTFPFDGLTLKSGYAFVKYASHQQATRALQLLYKLNIDGQDIQCSMARSQGRNNNDATDASTSLPVKTVYVRNLAATTIEEGLSAHFAPCGVVCSCRVNKDSDGVSKGFGFVEFEDAAMCANAIKTLDGSTLDGNVLTVNMARRPTGATRGGSGGGGRYGHRGQPKRNANAAVAAAPIMAATSTTVGMPPTSSQQPPQGAVPLQQQQQQGPVVQQQQAQAQSGFPYNPYGNAPPYSGANDPNAAAAAAAAAAYGAPYTGYGAVPTYNYPLEATTAPIGAPSLNAQPYGDYGAFNVQPFNTNTERKP